MRKLFLSGVSVTACVLAVVSIASATDLALPARPYYKAPPAPLLFSWTGCYIGGHIGAGWDTKATWTDLGMTHPTTQVTQSVAPSAARRAVATINSPDSESWASKVLGRGLTLGGPVLCLT